MSQSIERRSKWLAYGVLALGAFVFVAGGGLRIMPSVAEDARVIPAPAFEEKAVEAPLAIAVLAGGCFWGVQGVFQHVEGVTSAVSGYAGGEQATAQYRLVGTGTTGHAEAVQVTYDPRKISYGQILQVFFSVAHDPTQLDRQGPDEGNEYRSAIFPMNAEQARLAKEYIGQLDAAKVFDTAIVTLIEPDRTFYPAEDYHQDFMARHPTHPYIVINDRPKVENLKRIFSDIFRNDPVLVASAKPSGG